MRYVAVKFNEWDRDSYSYTIDDLTPIRPGDGVEVPTKRGQAQAIVLSIEPNRPAHLKPELELKAISRVLPRLSPPPGSPIGRMG